METGVLGVHLVLAQSHVEQMELKLGKGFAITLLQMVDNFAMEAVRKLCHVPFLHVEQVK